MGVLLEFLETTGFATMTWGNVLMIVIGLLFITLAITKHYEPLLLLPIGFGAIVGNIPSIPEMALSVYDEGSVLNYLYFGVRQGIFPPLIFLGIGAMTDFSARPLIDFLSFISTLVPCFPFDLLSRTSTSVASSL